MFRACAFEIVFFTLNTIGISNKKFHFIGTLIVYIVKYVAIEEIKVLLQHFLSVNPIFVVICGPKQPLQNCLSMASFMLFMFFKSTKWKHAYLLLPLKPEQFSRMLSQFSHLLSQCPIKTHAPKWQRNRLKLVIHS